MAPEEEEEGHSELAAQALEPNVELVEEIGDAEGQKAIQYS